MGIPFLILKPSFKSLATDTSTVVHNLHDGRNYGIIKPIYIIQWSLIIQFDALELAESIECQFHIV